MLKQILCAWFSSYKGEAESARWDEASRTTVPNDVYDGRVAHIIYHISFRFKIKRLNFLYRLHTYNLISIWIVYLRIILYLYISSNENFQICFTSSTPGGA